jgi:5,10-methylenetetrahydrofolate reductase
MSPLAAVALAKEQGVRTVVHVSCRDRNRLALQSQVAGAAALGSEGVLCVYGDPVEEIPRVKDLSATALIAAARDWALPHELGVGAVVNPFAPDLDRELRLLKRKVEAGARLVQSQMVFDLDALRTFLGRAADVLAGVRFYAGIALLRNRRIGRPRQATAWLCSRRMSTRRSARVAESRWQPGWRRNSPIPQALTPCTSTPSATRRRLAWRGRIS